MNHILVVSHCILNKASKVVMDEEELVDEYQARQRLLKLILEKDIQLIQLPCPEFMLFGSKRWGHVRDQFDFPVYRKACRRMLEPVMLQLQEYAGNKDRFNIFGIVSVEGSPSCGFHLTCRGRWGGDFGCEEITSLINTLEMTQGPGVFFEELQQLLSESGLDIPIFSIDEASEIIASC